MFILTTNQDLWARKLMNRDHSLGRKNILKFNLLFVDPIW
jgi:hypothetical protein